jgi:superfamily II DNA or RNA helicase
VQHYGYDIEIEDMRQPGRDFEFEAVDENSYSHILWPEGHPLAGKPIIIKDHQVGVINSYLENITGINIAPTGSGKTIVTSILSHKVEKYGRSIIIVPTKDLVTQTEEDYINFGLDVGVFFGDRKEYNKRHTICTWQSLESLAKKSKETDLDIDINAFFEDVVCVIVDETHKAKGAVLQKILSTYLANAPIRWGLTGTMPEEDSDKMGVMACIGPLLGKINTKELQDKGILAQLQIHVIQLQDTTAPLSGNYQAELKWLTTNIKRLEFLAKEVIAMAETGNTLVLVDRVQTGEMLQALIPDSIFVSGKMKSKARKDEYKEVQEVDGKVIIATFSVASTGININRIFNLVLFEAGKSFVKVIQSIGRGIRVAADKSFVNIYDICASTKYSKRHLTKRKKIYTEAEYPYTVTKVAY